MLESNIDIYHFQLIELVCVDKAILLYDVLKSCKLRGAALEKLIMLSTPKVPDIEFINRFGCCVEVFDQRKDLLLGEVVEHDGTY